MRAIMPKLSVKALFALACSSCVLSKAHQPHCGRAGEAAIFIDSVLCGQAGDAPLRTNDQWLSLTDQMNLGVRAIDLDNRWVPVSPPAP